MNEDDIEALAGILNDAAAPLPARRGAMAALAASEPGTLGRLRASGRIPPKPWPTREEGRTLGGDALAITALGISEEVIVATLVGWESEDPERAMLAARLAHAMAQADGSTAKTFEPLIRTLLQDSRPAYPHLPQNAETVGRALQEIHLQVAKRLGESDRGAFFEALHSAVRLSLRRGREWDALYGPFLAWFEAGGRASEVGAALLDTLLDASAPWRARLAAREAFAVLLGVTTHPSGVASGAADEIRSTVAVANHRIVAILMDSGTPADLREALRDRFHCWAPESVAGLQDNGILPIQPVPSRRVHRDWSPAAAERLSTHVSFEEVLSLLALFQPEDIDRTVSALRLAPAFASWLPGAATRLDPKIRGLIPSRVEVPMKSRPGPPGTDGLRGLPVPLPRDRRPGGVGGDLYSGRHPVRTRRRLRFLQGRGLVPQPPREKSPSKSGRHAPRQGLRGGANPGGPLHVCRSPGGFRSEGVRREGEGTSGEAVAGGPRPFLPTPSRGEVPGMRMRGW